jgi:amino acid permease
VGLAAAETESPRKTLPTAIKQVSQSLGVGPLRL